jgi:hypothetical protein
MLDMMMAAAVPPAFPIPRHPRAARRPEGVSTVSTPTTP